MKLIYLYGLKKKEKTSFFFSQLTSSEQQQVGEMQLFVTPLLLHTMGKNSGRFSSFFGIFLGKP